MRLPGEPFGFIFAFANCAGFMLYVTLGHRIANVCADGSPPARGSMSGIDQGTLHQIPSSDNAIELRAAKTK